MTRFVATIAHYSISRARVVDVGDTLAAAKRNATREFGGGYLDHWIQIYDQTYREGSEAVAMRKVESRKWTTLSEWAE